MGIPCVRVEAELPIAIKDADNEFREHLRKLFSDFASELFDERVTVWFSDECPDCQQPLKNKVCVNKSCLSCPPVF